jgi:hypothetical protein
MVAVLSELVAECAAHLLGYLGASRSGNDGYIMWGSRKKSLHFLGDR